MQSRAVRDQTNQIKENTMSEQEKKAKIADFLGVRVLTPLDDRYLEDVAGGTDIDEHHHDHEGDHEHVTPSPGHNDL